MADRVHKPKLSDQMADVPVGGFRVMPYAEASSCIAQLRTLKDGRKWSLRVRSEESDEYMVMRLADTPSKPNQSEVMADMPVGGTTELPYGEANSRVRQLRKLKDGRKWSLIQAADGNNFLIVRLA